jgi:phage replication O-like protein O
MIYQQTTHVPNMVFDKLLTTLTFGEFKVLMVIIRQTYGWIDQRTGKRKSRDRISHSQFIQKTKLSRRMVSQTLQSLVSKGLVTVTNRTGNFLHQPEKRKGVSWIYYTFQTEPPQPRRIYGVRQIGELLARY